MSAEMKLDWVAPAHRLGKPEARVLAVTVLAAPICEAAVEAWRAHLPEKALQTIPQHVKRGVRQAVRYLTCGANSELFEVYWNRYKRILPNYWEPPVAKRVPISLPAHQLRALRWTAALVALHVRNELEELHVKYTSDNTMPALNRGMRNSAYQVLLDNQDVAWELASVPRVMVDLQARGLEAYIPAVAG